MSDFQSDEIVTARKPHKCCECAVTIVGGQKYKRYFGVWDGDFSSYRMCIACSETFAWLDAELRAGPCGINQDEGICFTQLQDALNDFCHDAYGQCKEANNRLAAMIDRRSSEVTP